MLCSEWRAALRMAAVFGGTVCVPEGMVKRHGAECHSRSLLQVIEIAATVPGAIRKFKADADEIAATAEAAAPLAGSHCLLPAAALFIAEPK